MKVNKHPHYIKNYKQEKSTHMFKWRSEAKWHPSEIFIMNHKCIFLNKHVSQNYYIQEDKGATVQLDNQQGPILLVTAS